jgi:catechol 2,3-dioxygenase-like lactoylglutathione lyase family enzyme
MNTPQVSQHITFLHAQDLAATQHFYVDLLGLELARDQGTCLIFRVTESAFIGFCKHIPPIPSSRSVILTLVSDDVDGWHKALKDKGLSTLAQPTYNPDYHIYHFFLEDPDGYRIEIQRFEEPL